MRESEYLPRTGFLSAPYTSRMRMRAPAAIARENSLARHTGLRWLCCNRLCFTGPGHAFAQHRAIQRALLTAIGGAFSFAHASRAALTKRLPA